MKSESVMRAVVSGASELDVDLLVVPTWESDTLDDVPGLVAATAGGLSDARSRGEWRGKAYESCIATVTKKGWKPRRVLLIGTGSPRQSIERVRRVATVGMLAARARRVTSVAFWLRGDSGVGLNQFAEAAAEGLTLGEFETGSWKTETESHAVSEIVVATGTGNSTALDESVWRGRLVGSCSNDARTMANEPGNALTPTVFADRARGLAEGTGLRVEVIERAEMETLGLGLLLGVARGSAEPPKLIVVHHAPESSPKAPVLGLVGKGVTFDSGGISLKPADSMEQMKYDMAGGAAVLGAMRAIDQLRVPIRVVGVVPATENLPGGRAIKPGDVLRSAAGKTVEVINTDAEGRLVLGDALWYAKRCGATHLVDVATLTGGCVVALGNITTGLFGSPDRWVEAIREAADTAGDRVWPLPVFDEYGEQIRSDIADVKNTGGRAASAITAAMFLKVFAGDTPWAHLDVAGTAWADKPRPYQAKGPSGVGVRTLVELACASGSWGEVDAGSD